MEIYDLVIIGSGPAGYVAALRGGAHHMSVACIEKENTLGGTCLNVGCIPSKALLHSSDLYHLFKTEAANNGIRTGHLDVDLSVMMQRKEKIVSTLGAGIAHLFKKRNVTHVIGTATIAKDHVLVDGRKIGFKHLIIATGSTPIALPDLPFDENVILSSTGALSLKKIPKKLLLVGAGVIGLELGSVYGRLGSQIDVIEMMDRITPAFDEALSAALLPIFRSQGLTFHLKSKVARCEKTSKGVTIELDSGSKLFADAVLVAVGRKPCIPEGLPFEKAPSGCLAVDDRFQTNYPNIYAIGDVISGPMLAHKASLEAMVLVDALAGHVHPLDYLAIPNVMYTQPEVAAVGMTQQRAEELHLDVQVGVAQYKANSRARCSTQTDGFVKIVSEKGTGRLLGVHIIGAMASEMIGEAVLAMQQKITVHELAQLPHAHPTLSESIKEAALDCIKQALHF